MGYSYQDQVDYYSIPGNPEGALAFLSCVPDTGITDRDRCRILAAALTSVLERLEVLEEQA